MFGSISSTGTNMLPSFPNKIFNLLKDECTLGALNLRHAVNEYGGGGMIGCMLEWDI